ncbi:hypothetical protein EO98_16205 [Methanosarcina sp. 2.H.T.1A.6]|nr:hypothetical protein EO97_08965 [Methanosarcina sp. 2.H.T.1A.15]KKG17693.1 hypothetical protein EO94_12630 [Methanosarcina sp. 2.H.T.1A.3]KKG21933.1 hypothetical protein EO98_16205 [Methanosarcina sp. 2.H.T.1A.6]KKG25469.1 hypothetical protein EO96_00655 [Methanosarcina sp. 2.H.T.1A.8]
MVFSGWPKTDYNLQTKRLLKKSRTQAKAVNLKKSPNKKNKIKKKMGIFFMKLGELYAKG